MTATTLRQADGHWVGNFQAMASPCEVLIEVNDRRDAERILSVVSSEAHRIEQKFSRYLPDNIVHQINNSNGRAVAVDDETARLIDFARTLHGLSDGKFDITSGVFRKAWTFDGGEGIPDTAMINSVLPHVGWGRVCWQNCQIRLEPGMEIDLGGIGKEYAVDHVAVLLGSEPASCLVNFGGDIVVTKPRGDRNPWRVGIEDPKLDSPDALRVIHLTTGGLATSGDSHRFLLKDGVRFGHILDPTTGWPVSEAPRSITVAAGTCVQAGMVATLAMLQGSGAEDFLAAQDLRYWIAR